MNCPVCLNQHSQPADVQEAGGGYRVDCPVCGRYAISEEAWHDFLDPQSGSGSKLSSLCRARLAHRIRSANANGSPNGPKILWEDIERFVKDGCPGPTPAEQATNLIRYIGEEVSQSGERLESLPGHLYSIIGAPNPTLAGELVIELNGRGLVDGIKRQAIGSPPTMMNVNLTLDGWELYEAEKRGRTSGNYGFIAMKFGDPALDPFVADVVKPAVKARIGYDLVDMRDIARAGIIDNIMRAQIRDSAFVIVDLTHDNSGAYWEAGYAEGLGKPVIYICEKQKFDEAKTHFDTNHCTTVIWSADNADDFSRELVATLRRSLNLFPKSKNEVA